MAVTLPTFNHRLRLAQTAFQVIGSTNIVMNLNKFYQRNQ
jgi:hypothetical protein